MTDRDRLAADLETAWREGGRRWAELADRLIALGWTRLDEERLARALHEAAYQRDPIEGPGGSHEHMTAENGWPTCVSGDEHGDDAALLAKVYRAATDAEAASPTDNRREAAKERMAQALRAGDNATVTAMIREANPMPRTEAGKRLAEGLDVCPLARPTAATRIESIEAEAVTAALDALAARVAGLGESEWRDCVGACHDHTIAAVLAAIEEARR